MGNLSVKLERTKILMVIARLNVGGPAIQALTLTRELNNSEFETLLVHGNVARGEADMTGFRGMDVRQKFLLPELGRELHPVKDIITLPAVHRDAMCMDNICKRCIDCSCGCCENDFIK